LRALCSVIAFIASFSSAQSNALPIRKHEPLMMANFRDDVFGHSASGEQHT
jgi:hypothetical protein